VRDVDLELGTGSVTLLSGVNGSGKTTLLRIIAGLSPPTLGVARGVRTLAVVPDRFVPPARMTGRSYLRHQGRLRGLATAGADQRAEELSERLGVRPGLDVALGDLSKGNVQKVALAQAFLVPVELLAMDEPRSAIDPPAASALDDLVEEARRRGTAVVVSDPDAGATYSGATYSGARRYLLEDGTLRRQGGEGDEGDVGPAARVTVRLHRPGEDTPAFAHLAETWSPDGDGAVTLVVDAGRSDELLRRALGEGWSVVDVHRRPGRATTRPADDAGRVRP
jgi:ABC-2 type transport system ATP-binding protein